MDIEETPVLLPSAKPRAITPRLTIQPPLSRRAHGPGLIIIIPHDYPTVGTDHTLDPLPLQKWAEEGYAVAQLVFSKADFAHDLKKSVEALGGLPECDDIGKLALIGMISLIKNGLYMLMPLQSTRVQNSRRRKRPK